VAEDIGGLDAARPWIELDTPTFTVLIDTQHTVASRYNMVNVPTAIWINETGRLVRPNETAFVDNRFTAFSAIDASPYLNGIRDWLVRGDQSRYVMSPDQLRRRLPPLESAHRLADTYFKVAQYLVRHGAARDAIPYFKEAQRLRPESWNYKRQAWKLADPEKDYGTTFRAEVEALKGKPYYPPVQLP
jgi:hypothetical protein